MDKDVAVAIVSGGLDSTVLAYQYVKEHEFSLVMVSFDYGQRHAKELQFAAITAKKLQAEHIIIDLKSLGQHLTSALTTPSIEVPHGHYAAENMKITVVPNRNAIMLSIAYGIALSKGASEVGFAAHAGDHAIYPDCRPEFVQELNDALRTGNAGMNLPGKPLPVIEGPFLEMTKADIVALGEDFHVPFDDTWSCYEGGEAHCGCCGTCVERKEAFELAKVKDPTTYEA